jgi:sugar-specific transcriptional regulator TrmB
MILTREELAEQLTAFGLTINQAKTYLNIASSAKPTISSIAAETKIHEQDIYKILPKLEEMGLITRTVERPIIIRAVPPEVALGHIINTEQHKFYLRIKQLKKTCEALAEAIKDKQAGSPPNEIQTTFLTTDNAINNRLGYSFENATEEVNAVYNFVLMRRRLFLVEKWYQLLADHGVRTRIILDNIVNVEDAQKILKFVIPKNGDFVIRQNQELTVKPYLIIDNKEVFISTQRKTANDLQCLLWTNIQNIVSIYKDNFGRAWEKSKPIMIS